MIWIIEMLDNGTWLPTCGCALSRRGAQRELRGWREDNPSDKFRLRKYVREVKP